MSQTSRSNLSQSIPSVIAGAILGPIVALFFQFYFEVWFNTLGLVVPFYDQEWRKLPPIVLGLLFGVWAGVRRPKFSEKWRVAAWFGVAGTFLVVFWCLATWEPRGLGRHFEKDFLLYGPAGAFFGALFGLTYWKFTRPATPSPATSDPIPE